ncbi:unnamed protein product [Lepeophtheirus salmonis]|uniref:(salmon louse) hypothetical protein n=1 Tax=Lepeophtheirus salmonis TaxID=72036 RepID=A0A7R8HBT4_LEPSM|nr:unnamed protein product [Lepeophtheirus salmonis]CAF2994681.1 unnamed protein product [Lepeophtheirus salmonis]
MFNRIFVKDDEGKYQHIVWRDGDERVNIKIYECTRLMFGDKPKARRVLFKDTNVDYIATSVKRAEVASKILVVLDRILHCGGFKIKRWYSSALSSGETCVVIPVLGHNLDVESDYIRLGCSNMGSPRNSSSCFDAVENSCSIVVGMRNRLGYRSTRKEAEVWKTRIESLELLEEVQRIRSLRPKNVVGVPKIYGFADGGELPYGACVFVRWRMEQEDLKLDL